MISIFTTISLIILPIILYVFQTKTELKSPSLIVILIIFVMGGFNLFFQLQSNKENKQTTLKLEQIQKQLMIEQYKISSGNLFSPPVSRKNEQFRVIFGSNTFIGTPNIIVIDDIPLITMGINKNGELIVNALIYDNEDKLIGLINNNQWVIEPKHGLRKASGINWLKVWDKSESLILDIEVVSTKLIKLNGIFRKSGAEIIATDNGMTINAKGSGVGIGGS